MNEQEIKSIEAFLSTLRYNGYIDYIRTIADNCLKVFPEYGEDMIPFPKEFANDDPDAPHRIFWSWLVIQYGNYGTSPRTGWLEGRENFKNIANAIKKWVYELDIDCEFFKKEYEEYIKNGIIPENATTNFLVKYMKEYEGEIDWDRWNKMFDSNNSH